MPKPAELGTSFRGKIDRLRNGIERLEQLRMEQIVRVSDVELIYESSFVSAFGHFEGCLENILVEFVCGRRGTSVGHYAVVKPHTRPILRRLLYGHRQYVDMLPLNLAVEQARRFLKDGKPFSTVDPADQDIMLDASLIRNAIAHRSQHAVSRFRAKVAGATSLPPHRRFPGPLLRKEYRAFPSQSWIELYFETMEKIALKLIADWG